MRVILSGMPGYMQRWPERKEMLSGASQLGSSAGLSECAPQKARHAGNTDLREYTTYCIFQCGRQELGMGWLQPRGHSGRA